MYGRHLRVQNAKNPHRRKDHNCQNFFKIDVMFSHNTLGKEKTNLCSSEHKNKETTVALSLYSRPKTQHKTETTVSTSHQKSSPAKGTITMNCKDSKRNFNTLSIIEDTLLFAGESKQTTLFLQLRASPLCHISS